MDRTGQAEAPGARATISQELVALFKEYLGRGPMRARTYIEDDVVVCLLENTMTKAERKLAGEDHAEKVRELRRMFHESFADRAAAIVERATGRRVRATLSDHDPHNDCAAEIFLLRSEQ